MVKVLKEYRITLEQVQTSVGTFGSSIPDNSFDQIGIKKMKMMTFAEMEDNCSKRDVYKRQASCSIVITGDEGQNITSNIIDLSLIHI